jgi:hypothetical protein
MRVIRSSRDVSLAYLAVLLTGFVLYLWYGISIGNRVLIVTNAVSIVATATTLSVGLAFRRHGQPTVGPRRWTRQQAFRAGSCSVSQCRPTAQPPES